jgi:hypothetical protein
MLLDTGVDVRFADLPQIEGTAGRFMLKQMALVAELEARFISDRLRQRSPPPNAVVRSWAAFVLAPSSTRRPAKRARTPMQRPPLHVRRTLRR